MDHPPPASFPDPMQRIGTPVIPPHGTKPNPAYQDLLTLYAKVYGAEDGLAKALEPAYKSARDGEAWTGHAAREWTAELEDWNRRLGRTAADILHELAARLRATPPHVPIGTQPMQPGGPYPDPGGTMGPGPNPGGTMRPGPNPGGIMRPGPDPGGTMHPGPNPGGRFEPGPGPARQP